MLPAILTLIFAVTFAAAPFFTTPFGGFASDLLPIPQSDPPIQPAGYAFSIWSLIYIYLIVSAIYGLVKRPQNSTWDAVRWPLIASLVLGTPWLWVANNNAIWSTVLIFLMLATAIMALMRTPPTDRWWLRVPVALLAGWLTAASFVSLGVTMAGYGVLFNDLGWAYLGILLALVTAISVTMRMGGAPEYAVAVIWALIGIMVNNGMDHIGITLLAGVGVLLLLTFSWQASQGKISRTAF